MIKVGRGRVWLGFCLSMTISAVLVGCQRQQGQQAGPANGRYQLKGEVVSVDEARHEVVVKHEAIRGFMAAMTMPYTVKNTSNMNQLLPGVSITADVVVQNGEMWLENVRITNNAKASHG